MSRVLGIPIGREARESLENPSVPLSSPQAWSLLAGAIGTDSGVNVSEFTAMRSMAVWRCIHLIAGTVAQLPLRVFKGAPGDPVKTAVDKPWIDSPNPELTWFEYIETSLAHILLWGNSYWLPVLNNGGDMITQIWNMPPWAVSPTRKSSPGNGIPGAKVYNITVSGGLQLGDDKLIHIPGLGYDGIRGLSPIAHCRQGLGLGIAAEQYGARLFGSGSLMSGIVSTDQKMDEKQAETMKARWRDKVAGLQKSHEIIVMDAGLKWTPIGIPPEEAQFLQTRQFAVNEICRLYGVPPHLVMDVEKTTTWGSGIAEQSLGFLRYTLSQWLARYEQRITKRMCKPGEYAVFDTKKLLRGDMIARFAAWNVALASGWMTGNQVRAEEDLDNAGPALDVYAPIGGGGTIAPVPPGKEPKGE